MNTTELDNITTWACMPECHTKNDYFHLLLEHIDFGDVTKHQIQEAYNLHGVDGVEALFR